eukprot:COSAG02_NODE_3401_length_6805_cov_70.980763_5_plen_84_part_00
MRANGKRSYTAIRPQSIMKCSFRHVIMKVIMMAAAGAHPHQHARALLAGGGHLRPARAPQGAVVRLGDLTHRTEGSTVATEAG